MLLAKILIIYIVWALRDLKKSARERGTPKNAFDDEEV
jgi:hypothetical protein